MIPDGSDPREEDGLEDSRSVSDNLKAIAVLCAAVRQNFHELKTDKPSGKARSFH